MNELAPTRQRLLDAGMQLFAERGFRDTTVGDIEAAVGLQPRRGALYKHFGSKQDLLEAALQAHLDSAAAGAAEIGAIDFVTAVGTGAPQVRAMVWGLGRWFLDEMATMKDLTQLLEHEGARMTSLTSEVKDKLVDLSYRTAAALISAVIPTVPDPDATAVILLGSLVALHRTTWTFGSRPLDIDDDRALAAWTDLALSLLAVPAAGSDAT